MNIKYIWYKGCTKLRGSAVNNSIVDKDAKIEAGSVFANSEMGRFSYCGYDCFIINTTIGSFCSLSDNVSIGGGKHPVDWVSTSPAFYTGRDSLDKRLASLDFETTDDQTIIGNDVWIGRGAYIKSGVRIGTGAIIGMGSVVTKDVLPYSIVAGNPARLIRMRFSDEIIESLIASKWWEMDESVLKKYSDKFDDPERFLKAIQDDKE